MASNLLSIPLRQSRPIELGEELKTIIKRDYFQTASSFDSDLSYISGVRNTVSNIKDETVSSRDEAALKTYYQALQLLRKKFPDHNVEFAWYGTLAYGPSGPFRSRSFTVEQVNVLFQLGSLYSQLGIKESRHVAEGLKRACAYFQQSAGCFELILETIAKSGEDPLVVIPQDLEFETVSALKFLMLAQAHESIWQKAVTNSSLKDSVISKLAIQTSEYYSVALQHGNASDHIKLEWINHITVKKYHFKAAAYLRASLGYQDAFQYGEQVASLRVAAQSCNLALRSKKYVHTFVVEDLQGLSDTISTSLRTSEKDNDLIYLKIVPSEKDLKPLVGASMVKPTPPNLENDTSRPLFSDLLPFVIIQVAQAFRERTDNYIKERVFDPLVTLGNMLTKFLTERNLPSSIDSIQQPENLPESIIQHSQEITTLGGSKMIEESIADIASLASQCKSLADECRKRLQLEADEENILRQRQGSQRWVRPASHIAAESLLQKIHKMEAYLDQAKSGDEQVKSKYLGIKPLLDVYIGGYQSLISLVPRSSYTQLDAGITVIVSDLRTVVNEANSLEDSRRSFTQTVEIKSRENTVLPKVIEEFRRNKERIYDSSGNINERAFEGVYDEHIAIFNADIQYVETSKNKQITLENDIDTLNGRFLSEFRNQKNDSQKKRQEVLQSLEAAYSKFTEVVSNLNEGRKFYNDFILRGTGVLKECDDFLHGRRIEGRQLEHDLQQQQDPSFNHNDRDEIDPKSQHQHQRNNNEQENIPLAAPRGSSVWNPNQGIKFG